VDEIFESLLLELLELAELPDSVVAPEIGDAAN
jgi:hypothetical protein